MQNRPQIFAERGNALFVHVPKSFTDQETESWANKEKPLGDAVWKVAPITKRNPQNRVECTDHPSDPSWHIALTIEGKEFNGGNDGAGDSVLSEQQEGVEAMDRIRKMLGDLQGFKGIITRPEQPIVAANGAAFGYEQLFGVKPETSTQLKGYLQHVMRGPSEISPWLREMVLTNVAITEGGTWCVAVHREVSMMLHGGTKEQYIIDCTQPKATVLGAFAIAISQGIYIPQLFIKKMKEAGWSDDGIHDAVLLVGTAKLLNTYVEGIAVKIPENPKSQAVTEAAKQLTEKGYV